MKLADEARLSQEALRKGCMSFDADNFTSQPEEDDFSSQASTRTQQVSTSSAATPSQGSKPFNIPPTYSGYPPDNGGVFSAPKAAANGTEPLVPVSLKPVTAEVNDSKTTSGDAKPVSTDTKNNHLAQVKTDTQSGLTSKSCGPLAAGNSEKLEVAPIPACVACQLTDKLEKFLVKLPDVQSMVSKVKVENDILSVVGKMRDLIENSVKDKEDKDRTKLLDVFGGDCIQTVRMKGLLEAAQTKLSSPKNVDSRLTDCLKGLKTVEEIIRDKGHGKVLKEAEKKLLPWRPPPQNDTEPDKVSSLQPQVNPPSPQKLADDTIADKEEDDDVVHQVLVEASASMNPDFDFAPEGCFVLELASIEAEAQTTVAPPFPELAGVPQPLANQTWSIPVPELAKFIFDASKKTPEGGKVEATLQQIVEVMEIPGSVAVSIKLSCNSPFSSIWLKDERGETTLHYEVDVAGQLFAETKTRSHLLKAAMTLTIRCCLSGAGSAGFSSDGLPLPPPR